MGKIIRLFLLLLLVGLIGAALPFGCKRSGGDDEDAPGADDEDDNNDSGNPAELVIEEVSIPMSDGESLAALVRRPKDENLKLPTVLIQTPYNKTGFQSWLEGEGDFPLFNSPDYVFVVVDWRGFFGSLSAMKISPDRGVDGYDTVEWIAAQNWSDGKVGMWGPSALCTQQYKTAVEKPPHLAAAVPIFCQMNLDYQLYYPGGVLREEYLDFIGVYYGGKKLVMDHPTKDNAWRLVSNLVDPGDIDIPMLVIAGWYDLQNSGSFDSFASLGAQSASAVRGLHRLLVGPWIHFAAGGETTAGGAFDEMEINYYDSDKIIQRRSLDFFDYHMRGIDNGAGDWGAIIYRPDGEPDYLETESWPPVGVVEASYYLDAGEMLSAAPPVSGEVVIPYDPSDPSPSIGGSTLALKLDHGPRYQDEVLARSDSALFVTPELETAISIAGKVRVELGVSTTGADTDFAIRLTDVDPDGRHLLIGEGIRRLKLRDDFSSVSPVVPGQDYSITVESVNHLAYRFAAGHRIGLIVTSSNSPRFAPNPNSGDDFYTDVAHAEVVDNTITFGAASRLVLPVVE